MRAVLCAVIALPLIVGCNSTPQKEAVIDQVEGEATSCKQITESCPDCRPQLFVDEPEWRFIKNVVLDDRYVYYNSCMFNLPNPGYQKCQIKRVKKSGGTPQILAADGGMVTEIAVDDRFLYYIGHCGPEETLTDCQLGRMNKDGSNPVIMQSAGVRMPTDMKLHGDFIYWHARDQSQPREPSIGIVRVPKLGGPMQTVVRDPDIDVAKAFPFGFFEVDDEHVYYTSFFTKRARIADGVPELLFDPRGPEYLHNTSTAIDAHNFYWLADNNLMRLPKAGGALAMIPKAGFSETGIEVDPHGNVVWVASEAVPDSPTYEVFRSVRKWLKASDRVIELARGIELDASDGVESKKIAVDGKAIYFSVIDGRASKDEHSWGLYKVDTCR